MKKWIALVLTLAALLVLTACSLSFLNRNNYNNQPDEKDDPPAQSQEPEIPDSPAGPDEPVPPNLDEEPLLPDPDKNEDGEDVPDPGEDGEEDGETAAKITASHTDVTLKSAGETFTLSAKGVDGTYAVSFSSANPAVAEVDELTGAVTAVAPGNTRITMHVECEAGQFDFDCIIRCSWKEEEADLPASGTVTGLPSLNSFFTTLQGKYEGLGSMMVLDNELLNNYYPGLDQIAAVEEVLIQETMMTTANVAVGLVKLSGDATLDDIIAVQNIFQARISTQASGGAWYPASCETWENGVITSVSNCVGMFVYPDEAQAMADLFTESFSN